MNEFKGYRVVAVAFGILAICMMFVSPLPARGHAAAASCLYSVSPTDASLPGNGGAGSFGVYTTGECPWLACSNDNWITITDPPSLDCDAFVGSGSGTVTYNVDVNPNPTPRQGTVTLHGASADIAFTISQAAGIGPNCIYSISPDSRSHGPGAETGVINVTTADGCGWAATSGAPWITITLQSISGSSGTATYSLSPNADAAARTGRIQIADQVFTVYQAGMQSSGGCSYSLLPAAAAYAPAGGSGSFTINASDGCAWTPNGNASWIIITSGGGGGSGRGQIGYTVTANLGPARQGTLTVGDQTFTVDQAGPGDHADLSVTITADPSPVAAGTRVSCTILLHNAGPDPATGVTLSTATPGETSFASLSGPGSSTTPAIGGAGAINSVIGSIPSNGSASFTLEVHVIGAPGSSLLENAAASSLTADPVPGNNSATSTTSILGGGLIELSWDQAPSSTVSPTPPPANLKAGPAASRTAAASSSEGAVSPGSDTCALAGYNVYLSNSMSVEAVPANLWLALSPTNRTLAPVAPAGTYYVVTALWNCGGTIIESGLAESGGSNQTALPAPPTITNVKVGGKLRATGSGFSDAVDVFIDGVAFSKPARIGNSNTLIIQRGPLVDGRTLSDVLLPGKTVMMSFRNSNGGIGAFAYAQP